LLENAGPDNGAPKYTVSQKNVPLLFFE